MNIRELQTNDLEQLLLLYVHLHEVDESLPDRATVADLWQTIQADANLLYFGGFVGEQMTASCNLALVPNLTRGCRPYGVIENVVTHADFRRRGYGQAILRHALAAAWDNDCYKVMLMTGRLNEQTFRFYESVGFDRHSKQAFIAKRPKL
ncbi:MAG: GNAT family N-acetyltransferase [Chloroflexota bacterium]